VPFLSIVGASMGELALLGDAGAPIGVIATRATLVAKIFDSPLQHAGYTPLLPDEAMMNTLVLPAIELVKAGQAVQGGHLIEQAVQALLSQGAQAVILACTETPLALDAVQSPLRAQCVDTTAALARRCVGWWRFERASTAATGS
jgi:aspartate racemase